MNKNTFTEEWSRWNIGLNDIDGNYYVKIVHYDSDGLKIIASQENTKKQIEVFLQNRFPQLELLMKVLYLYFLMKFQQNTEKIFMHSGPFLK